MTIQTKVVWAIRPKDMSPGPERDALLATTLAKRDEMRRNGIVSEFRFADGAGYRTWPTTEAAQEWIDFLNQLTTKPISAEIIIT